MTEAEILDARNKIAAARPFKLLNWTAKDDLAKGLRLALGFGQFDELYEDWLETKQREESYSEYNLFCYWTESGLAEKHIMEWGF